jgi:hypothetical protein
MRHIREIVSQLCLITLVLLSVFATSNAAEPSNIQTEGQILMLSRDSINVSDFFFPIIATVKVKIPGRPDARLKHLKVGNLVRIELQKYNGKFYVDRITLLPKLSSGDLEVFVDD